jgi:lipopolysaccharide transport system ATP-binding protein
MLKIGEADHGNRYGEELWALRDVSFTVEQGEVLGVIGRNGAGKSTLLKILSRVTAPTSGKVKIKGRVASLLEVGTGFHPELTGRENIYLNGAILGMSRREIDHKFDEIVDFAEVEKFIDTPVKRYSSGMYVRLAFAVAAHLEPEILVVDEVLAVGDAAFQKKCLGKMGDVAKEGRTVLFVSHQMDMILSLCMRSMLLNCGTVFTIGSVDYVVDAYIRNGIFQQQKTQFEVDQIDEITLQIVSGRVLGDDGKEKGTFDVFSKITLEFEYILTKPIEGAVVNFELRRNGSTLFLSFDTDEDPILLDKRVPGCYVSRIQIPSPLLKPGNYSICTNTGIINTTTFQHLEDILSLNVELQSKPSSLLGYADKRKGIIAVPLKWHTEKKSSLL